MNGRRGAGRWGSYNPGMDENPFPSTGSFESEPQNAVVVLNDDLHTFAYVMETFTKVFGYTPEKCYQLAMAIHTQGRVVVWSGPIEAAQQKRDQIRSAGPDLHASTKIEFPLGTVIEPFVAADNPYQSPESGGAAPTDGPPKARRKSRITLLVGASALGALAGSFVGAWIFEVPREPGDPLGQSAYALGAVYGCLIGLGLAVWRLAVKDRDLANHPANGPWKFQFSLRLVFGWTALFALYLAWPVPPQNTGVRDLLMMLGYCVVGASLGRLAGGIVNDTIGRVGAALAGTLTVLRFPFAEIEKLSDIRIAQLVHVLYFGIWSAAVFEMGLWFFRSCRTLDFRQSASRGQTMTKTDERIEWLLRLPIIGGPCLVIVDLVAAYAYRGVPGTVVMAAVGAASGVMLFATGIVVVRLRRRLAEYEHRIAKLEKDLQPSENRMG